MAHLLMLHDLHPVSVENRVREAIAAAGAYAVVLGIEDGVVQRAERCRRTGGRRSRRRSIAAAPDVERVEVVEMPEPVVVLPQVSA